MKKIVLFIVILMIAACGRNPGSSQEPMQPSCDTLNAKYIDYTKEQLLSEAEGYENAAIAQSDSEYYWNLYGGKANEFKSAAACRP